MRLPVVEPFPSWTYASSPQHLTPPRLVSAQVWYSPAAIRVADDADCAPCATGVTENARLAAARNATPVAATAVTPTPSRSLNRTPPSRLGQRRITSGG